MTKITEKFKWNHEQLIQHQLDEVILDAAGIEKLDAAEVFVEHPTHEGYYVSQYGRAVSLKRKDAALLGAFIGGQPDRQYLYYGFINNGEKQTIGAHRAVADVFCPNFWKGSSRLEAHHLDGNKLNNDYRNLILLTTPLHAAIHKIKTIVWFKDGKIVEYRNPLDLVYETGLKLEEILLANKGKKKPLKCQDGYTVFDIRGHLIGFKYYPEKSKKKK